MPDRKRVRIEDPDQEELDRVQALLRKIGGRNVAWGAGTVLEVWIAEARLEAERRAARRVLGLEAKVPDSR